MTLRHNFRKLDIWKKSRLLVSNIYTLATSFPQCEKYGLTSQIQRATVSIVTNIAEGSGRTTDLEFCRFLDFSIGSAFEVETLLILASDLNYISEEELKNILDPVCEVQKQLCSFKQYLLKEIKS